MFVINHICIFIYNNNNNYRKDHEFEMDPENGIAGKSERDKKCKDGNSV